MRKFLILSIFLLGALSFWAPKTYAQSYPITIFDCHAGFTTTSGACQSSSALGSGPFWNLNGVTGSAINVVPTGCVHCGNGVNYQTDPVNIQAFTATWTFVPNEYNGAFVLQNNTVPLAFGTCSPGSCGFSAGAGYEAGFFQGFGSTGYSVTQTFALEFYDNHSINNCTNPTCSGTSYGGSTAQIYQSQQNPYTPNYGDENFFFITNKIFTTPVQLSSPATTQQTTTGDTYSATVIYDGTTFTYNLYDVTAGGTCTPVTSGTCFSQSWNNVDIPAIVGGNTAYLGITGGSNQASAHPFYLDGLTYSVLAPPSTPSLQTYTSSSAAGAPHTNAPTFSPIAGSYSGTQNVTISSTTPNSYVIYTLATTTPTLMPQCDSKGGAVTGTVYSTPVAVSATSTLYAQACVGTTNATRTATSSNLVTAAYTINSTPQAASPIASPAAGTYSSTQNISLSSTSAGSIICFNTTGASITIGGINTCPAGSTLYSTAISVGATETIYAKAGGVGYTDSNLLTAPYTINIPTTATPTFSPTGGPYTTPPTVTIASATSGANLCITTDGTTPTATGTACTNGTQQSSPYVVVVGSNVTYKVIAVSSGHTQSALASQSYSITGSINIYINGTIGGKVAAN